MRKKQPARKRRRPITLLEVTIALFLTSFIVVFLFGFFREISMENIDAERLDEKIFPLEKTEMRLGALLSALPEEEKETPPLFYTEYKGGNALTFAFDNGIDEDPLFSGTIRASLGLSKKQLELHLLPLEEDLKTRKEILMDNVKNIEFGFFHLENKEWERGWDKESGALPAMMKIQLTKEDGQAIEFIFFLPPSTKPVIYS